MNIVRDLSSTASTRQRGFVLVSAIILMVALTIVILSLMRTSILEERMVANSRDWNNAFQAAEAALRDAEREILTGNRISGQTGFTAGCNFTDARYIGLCLPNTCPSASNCSPVWVQLDSTDTAWKTGSGSGSKSVAYGAKTTSSSLRGVAAQPRYIVEALSVAKGNNSQKTGTGGSGSNTMYRITAVGFGMNTSSRVMLQSTVVPN